MDNLPKSAPLLEALCDYNDFKTIDKADIVIKGLLELLIHCANDEEKAIANTLRQSFN